jgi:hypothetical protein
MTPILSLILMANMSPESQAFPTDSEIAKKFMDEALVRIDQQILRFKEVARLLDISLAEDLKDLPSGILTPPRSADAEKMFVKLKLISEAKCEDEKNKHRKELAEIIKEYKESQNEM